MRRTIYSLLSVLSAAVLSLSFLASLDTGTTGAEATPAAEASASGSASASASAGAGSTSSSTAGSTTTQDSTASDDTSGESTADPSASAPASSESSGSSSDTGLTDGTFTGTGETTPYGTVQVQVTVTGGVITSSEAIEYPNAAGREQQVNGTAIPLLNAEAVSAQSATIDMVTGATYTSEAYQTSLQAALDEAAS